MPLLLNTTGREELKLSPALLPKYQTLFCCPKLGWQINKRRVIINRGFTMPVYKESSVLGQFLPKFAAF